ncbi:MAG: hypothetical protein IJ824_05295 [Alphaproteobacteria bacterium]|nr:hypothetical protein [Alphaproteobacteria bacterium]
MRATKYKKEYNVKSHEVDCHGFLRLLSLMSILQDIAVENADKLGLGLEVCARHDLAWVGSNYLVKIFRMPRQHESFVIETWPAEKKLWGAIRDFTMTDESGKPIILASSQWVLIDAKRRRPVMLSKYFPDYEAFGERALKTDFPKLPTVGESASKTSFKVRFDDIDVNGHVNNTIYPLWASESVDKDYRMTHLPSEIELCFKKEALYGETVDVLTEQTEDESLHCIYNRADHVELAQCRIKWQNLG